MIRFLAIRLAACLVVAAAVFLTKSAAEESAVAAQTVTLHWQPTVSASGGACVGSEGFHGREAYDLTSGTDCGSSNAQLVTVRTVGLSATQHRSLGAFISFGTYTTGCTFGEADTVEYVTGILPGTYRFLHTDGSNTTMDIWAGPSPGTASQKAVAYTIENDPGQCDGFSGQHVHQDANYAGAYQPCFYAFYQINNVWNYISEWVHKWVYTEGSGGVGPSQPNG